MKPKKIFSFFSILLLLTCCKPKETHYSLIDYKPGDEIHKVPAEFQQKRKGNYYLLSYETDHGHKTFIFTKDTLNRNNAFTALGFKFDHQELIANKTQKDTVFIFTKGNDAASKARYYWSPRHGVFLVQTTNHPRSQVLRSIDETENIEIENMIRATCPDTAFYFGDRLKTVMHF